MRKPAKRRERRPAGQRGSTRRLKQRIRTLLAVLGSTSIVLAAYMALHSVIKGSGYEMEMQLSLIYLGSGSFMLLIYWLMTRTRLSESQKRVRRMYKGTQLVSRSANEPTIKAEGQQGMVLIFVLLVLALVVTLIVHTQLVAKARLRTEEVRLVQTRIRTAASDAVYQALKTLTDEERSIDHTNEPWASPREITDPTGISVLVRITDENRFFDFNNLALNETPSLQRRPSDVAMDIMTLCGDFTPIERVESLISWIDEDDEGYAESHYYAKLDPPYEAANGLLESWSELLLIRGFDREYFNRHERVSLSESFNADIIDCFTILPVSRTEPIKVNINTANEHVLLGIAGFENDTLVKTILALRSLAPIVSLDELVDVTGDRQLLERLRPYLATQSNFFRVEARSYSEGHAEDVRVLAHRGSDGSIDILQWVY